MKKYIILVLILIPLLSISQRLYIVNNDTNVLFTQYETRLVANKLVDMNKYKDLLKIDSVIINDYKEVIKLKDNQINNINNKFLYSDSSYKKELFNNEVLKFKYDNTKKITYVSAILNAILIVILIAI